MRKTCSNPDRLFAVINISFLSILGLIMMVPLLSVLASSLSSGRAVDTNQVFLWPVELTLDSWQHILGMSDLWSSFYITLISTVVGTFLCLFFTVLLAYALSKEELKIAKVVMVAIVVTMVFKYPIIPYFLTLKGIGLYNSLWVLVVPHIISAYNMIIMRTFFKQFPAELEEAAKVEGCGYFLTLFKVVLPSSKAVLATIGLFYAVVLWNQFQHPLMFLQNRALFPLQMKLREFITSSESMFVAVELTNTSERTIKAATIIFAVLPILIVYPFIQRYFVKGAMLGAVKG
jgi:putative aldouronate transport system permease protein